MTNSSKSIKKLVTQVKENLELYADYHMNDSEIDELRLTGRFTINTAKLLPHLPAIINYLRNNDTTWTLSLNAISCDFEITLKGFLLLF